MGVGSWWVGVVGEGERGDEEKWLRLAEKKIR